MDRDSVEELKRHFDTKVEELKRHFGIASEQLRSDVSVVAEGQQMIWDEIGTFRAEVAQEFDETRALVRLSYSELDRRVRT